MTDHHRDNLVICRTESGQELCGNLVRVGPGEAAFELYELGHLLRLSEVIPSLTLHQRDQVIYEGKATVTQMILTSAATLCEARLETDWSKLDFELVRAPEAIREGFHDFIKRWGQSTHVSENFKLVVAEIQSFLTEFREWSERLELIIRSSPSGDRLVLEKEVLSYLGADVVKVLDTLFDKYEQAAAAVTRDHVSSHYHYARRQLHPLLLCAPFVYRTYYKPLGYAGDYEMVNMLGRDPLEGGSLYAKVVNLWFLQQAPARAHRNRISYLTRELIQVLAAHAASNQPARILNVGCGPGLEIQALLQDGCPPARAEFSLLDFNQETLNHLKSSIEAYLPNGQSNLTFRYQRKSVQQILKEAGKIINQSPGHQYNFIYCAGLFDYLTDQVCQRLVHVFYHWLAPGGRLILTNVDTSNPRQRTMESLMDWHLLYRDSRQAQSIMPPDIAAEDIMVKSESLGVNIIIEIAKPTPTP